MEIHVKLFISQMGPYIEEKKADTSKLAGKVQGAEYVMPILAFKLLGPEYLGVAQLEKSKT